MTRFEMWTSAIGSNRSTNCATTTAQHRDLLLYCIEKIGHLVTH